MAPKITFIKDIKAGTVDWRIKVRVVHLWKIPEYNNPNVTKSMEMVLIDEKSGKIQGSVKQNLLDMFENILQEGTCYLIQNLMVAQNDPKFRATDHRYKLTFMRTTMCMKMDSAAIPENVFKFVTFPEISTGRNATYLIDIIGHVVERGDLRENEKNGVKTLLMDIVLEDLQGNRMDCALWGNYAAAMHQYLTANGPTTLVVVILQGSKMRLFNGKIGISNAFDATKLLINPTLKECVDYKERMKNVSLSLSKIVSYASGQSSISVADDFLQTPKMTISDMFDVDKECVCVVAAKIIDFDQSMGWYYDACNKCAKKVTQRVGKLYYCGKCAIMVTSNRRCRLHAQVIDESGSAYFTLFDRVAMQCLENPGANLFDSNDQGSNAASWPSVFNALLNKDMLFKIQVTKQNIENSWQTYTVKKITAEPSLIEQFRKQYRIKEHEDIGVHDIVSAEIGDNIKTSVNSDEAVQIADEFDSGEAVQIADESAGISDPKNDGTENTPENHQKGKRIFEDVDCASPIDGYETQNSTTKLQKLKEVKKEPTN